MPYKKLTTELKNLISQEEDRQNTQLQLIPSENHVSKDVREAVGSVLMNKYSEGAAGKRYYQGNHIIDDIEFLVKKAALDLFDLDPNQWGVIVQAATGSIANLAVTTGLLETGSRVLSMHLYDGGHLSHGWKLPDGKKVTISSKLFESYFYMVDPDTQRFDYGKVQKRAEEVQPKMIISGGTAYPRTIDHERMKQIAQSVGAYYLADVAHEAGLIAGKAYPSPFPFADVVTMTTRKTLRGPVGAIIFARKELIGQIESALFPGIQGGPLNHSIAGIGIALAEAMKPEFKDYAAQVIKNAQAMANKLQELGYHVVSGGTDKHLLLLDLRNKEISGTVAALALEKANLIVNKNTVPNDTGKPWNPSGIRLGTPAITTRGMKEQEAEKIALWIHEALENRDETSVLEKIGKAVTELAKKFPIP
ncbi:MAG: serine hydroxymethyltransferase [Candidatus Dojkabacteria bacterium]|nr:MAG: serine hydroxymethyltransferase [Candidatus Dojkabacteria bacterium]